MPLNDHLSTTPSGIVLPAHTLTVYDPAQVFAKYVSGRKVVYLDNNFWIDLRDEKTAAARECLAACIEAVERQQAVFPVGYPAVSELMAIPANLRLKQADLMDRLSHGVTIRNMHVLHRMEAEDLFQHLFFDKPPPDRRRQAFTRLADYIGDGTMEFPEGWPAEALPAFLKFYDETITIRWIVEHVPTKQPGEVGVERYGPLINQQRRAHREHLGVKRVPRDVHAHEERAGLYNSLVAPLVKAALPRFDLARLRKIQGADGKELLKQAFRAVAPSIETLVQIFARQAQDVDRKTTAQDFWDIDHAAMAFAYADAFCTADAGLSAVLPEGARRPPTAASVHLSTLEALTTWLQRECATQATGE